MLTLIVMVVFGLALGYFATQNTLPVDVNLAGTLLSMPIYVLSIGSVLIGLLIAGIISAVDSLTSSIALHSRDSKIKQKEHTVEQLSQRIQNLEVENARLRGENPPITLDQAPRDEPKSFFRRFHLSPS